MIIDHILAREGKEPLNSSYYASNYPDVYAAAERIFGSWRDAIESCGLNYDEIRKYREWSSKKVIETIKTAFKNKEPLNSNYIQDNNRPLYMAALKRFKSWGEAVKAAGIDYKKIRLRRKMTREEIRQEILELYGKDVDLAYPYMRAKYQYLLAAGMKKIGDGSWAAARRKCGIKINFRLPKHKRKLKFMADSNVTKKAVKGKKLATGKKAVAGTRKAAAPKKAMAPKKTAAKKITAVKKQVAPKKIIAKRTAVKRTLPKAVKKGKARK